MKRQRRGRNEERASRQAALPKDFVRAVREHNRSAILASLLSLGGTILLWPFLYFLAFWFWLLALTVGVGPYAQVPERFLQDFVVLSLTGLPLMLFLERWMNDCHAAFLDRNQIIRWTLELLVFPYKMFLGIFGNLTAVLVASRGTMKEAVRFLRLLDDMHHLETRRIPVELPKKRQREKVLQMISMLELVRYQQIHNRLYIFLREPPRVRKLIYSRVRFQERKTRRARAREKRADPRPPRLRLR
jgi:hypothetical protein